MAMSIPWGCRNHRVRVAERKMHLLALELGAVANAHDVELLLEPLGDAAHGIRDQTAREPVKLAEQGIVLQRGRLQQLAVELHADAARASADSASLGPLNLDSPGLHVDLDALGIGSVSCRFET